MIHFELSPGETYLTGAMTLTNVQRAIATRNPDPNFTEANSKEFEPVDIEGLNFLNFNFAFEL